MSINSKNISGTNNHSGKILSLHPVIDGDAFFWERGVWDNELFQAIKNAEAVILPQTVSRELYCFCRKMCPHVFPNYDLRFQWEGKIGDTMAFWAYNAEHPHTLVFPRVETLRNDHPDMEHRTPELPPYPFVIKGAHSGEGRQVWLISNKEELDEKLQFMLELELHGSSGFVIQEYLPGLTRDLRVVVIGNQIYSYWRTSEGFLHNIAQGGEIDTESDRELQAVGREKVREFCLRTNINLAAFDLVYPNEQREPVFLEINYTFGRTGLDGSENFYRLLKEAVDQWLIEVL